MQMRKLLSVQKEWSRIGPKSVDLCDDSRSGSEGKGKDSPQERYCCGGVNQDHINIFKWSSRFCSAHSSSRTHSLLRSPCCSHAFTIIWSRNNNYVVSQVVPYWKSDEEHPWRSENTCVGQKTFVSQGSSQFSFSQKQNNLYNWVRRRQASVLNPFGCKEKKL